MDIREAAVIGGGIITAKGQAPEGLAPPKRRSLMEVGSHLKPTTSQVPVPGLW